MKKINERYFYTGKTVGNSIARLLKSRERKVYEEKVDLPISFSEIKKKYISTPIYLFLID